MIRILISEVTTDRVPVDRSDLADLEADMAKHGLKTPILVRENMILIDGQRRLAVAKALGWEDIEAIVTDDLEEACAILAPLHEGIRVDGRRLYDFHRVLRELAMVRISRLKNQGLWRRAHRPADKKEVPRYVTLMKETFNLPFTSYVERIARLFAKADGGDEQAIDLLKRALAGEISLNGAAHVLDQRKALNGDIDSLSEQRKVLTGSVRNLHGLIKTMKKLGPLKIPREELDPLIEQLRYLRSELYILTRKVIKESEKSK
jgi:ParB-like nuclease family protein